MTTNADEIRKKLIEFFITECRITREEVEAEQHLFSNNRLDSLDFLDLTSYLHEQFGIEVETTEMGVSAFDNLDAITQLVISKTS